MAFSPDALYNWQDATSSSVQPILLLNHQAYQCQGLPSDPPIVFRPPVGMAKGYSVKIVGYGRHFKVIQNANQYMYQGPSNTTTGATGYIQSLTPYDEVVIQCMLANTSFLVHVTQGTISFN